MTKNTKKKPRKIIASKNDDGGRRQNLPLDGDRWSSQRSVLWPGKWIRQNEETHIPKLWWLGYY